MNNLTVVILTKNEEKNIRKCIESFEGIAKRFVIVDSYSEDNTKKICNKLKEKVTIDYYERDFLNHADQLNWALANTNINTEWTMRIDADEELTKNLSKEIFEELGKLSKDINGIVLKRRVYFLGKWIKYGGIYPNKLLRIFRTNTAYCEQKEMDEHMVLKSGKTVEFKSDLIDYNDKDLNWWIIKHNWYSNKEALEYLNLKSEFKNNSSVKPSLFGNQAQRRRWMKNKFYYELPLFLRPTFYFVYRYFFRLGFLDGKEGLMFHFLQGYWYRFLVDSKIHEITKLNKKIEIQGELKS